MATTSQLPLFTYDDLRNPPNEEKTVYVEVGWLEEATQSTLSWAIQNFNGWTICIFYVCQSRPSESDKQSDFVSRRLRKSRTRRIQARMDDYLRICSDAGVRAKKVDFETDWSEEEEGIVKLVEVHKVKRLVMGVHESFDPTNKRPHRVVTMCRKPHHVNLKAPSFCNVYFVSNGRLIYKRDARVVDASGKNEQSTSSNRSHMTETEAVFKVTILEKLYTEELKKRKLVEGDLEMIIEDRNRVMKEAADQKTILEDKISVLELKISVNNPELSILWERERLDLQDKLDEAVRLAKDLLNQSLETYSRMESFEVFSSLYNEELRKRKVIEEQLEKINEDKDRAFKESTKQITILKDKVSSLEQEKTLNHAQLILLQVERSDLQTQLDDTAKLADELLDQSLHAQRTTESSNFFSTLSSSEIVESTNGFDPSMILRESEHGNIFKGLLYKTPVMIRLMFDEDLFKKEVGALSNFRHPNLGNLIGACKDSLGIVYEDLPNLSLEECLMGTNQAPPLSWQGRIRIAHEICSALVFLHSSRPNSLVHAALRPSCIFLDSHFTCKIIGFDFSHIINHNVSSSSPNHTTYIYTNYYTDPLFTELKEVSPMCDVYSFGVILLQLLTGMSTTDLIDKVQKALNEEQFGTLLDDSVGDWPFTQAQQLARLGLRCCDPEPSMRPDLKLDVWEVMKPMVAACGSALTFKLSEAPSYFICPISYEVMIDPQVAADGHTYEAEVLKQWLDSGHNTSPMTNLPFQHNHLTPNLPLRSAVQEWLQHQSR